MYIHLVKKMFGNLTLHSPGTTEKYHMGAVYKNPEYLMILF